MDWMDPFDAELLPPAFGLGNPGAACYLNSFLQVLAACTSFVRQVFANAEYIGSTGTGRAVLTWLRTLYTYEGGTLRRRSAPLGAAVTSGYVLSALVRDLAVRRPRVHFGNSQECASEALMHLLDMMEPHRPCADLLEDPGGPVSRLFLHRSRCDVYCRSCGKIVSKVKDKNVIFMLFHLDDMAVPPDSVETFSKAIRQHISKLEDFTCPECQKKNVSALRMCQVAMVPEIIFCSFNEFTTGHTARYFPERIEFPVVGRAEKHVFRLVGEIIHQGNRDGGHYWAKALRAGGTYLMDDTRVSLSKFAPGGFGTYIVVYHYDRTE